MLYNEEIKREFISSLGLGETIEKQLENIFSRIGEFECSLDRDLCQIDNKKELLPVLLTVSGNRSWNASQRLKYLKRYVKWCAENNKFTTVCDIISDITAEEIGVEYIRNHMAANPADFRGYLDSFLRSDDMKTIDIVYKCVLWLAYAGIPEESIVDIQQADVDFDVFDDIFLVSHEDRQYPVPSIAHKTFDYCVNLESFKFTNPRFPDSEVDRKRNEGTELLRGIVSKSPNRSYKVLTQNISNRVSGSGIQRRISYRSAMWSGFFFRLNQMENITGEIDFKFEALRFMGKRGYKLDKSRATMTTVENKKAKDVESDYKLWLKAFQKKSKIF